MCPFPRRRCFYDNWCISACCMSLMHQASSSSDLMVCVPSVTWRPHFIFRSIFFKSLFQILFFSVKTFQRSLTHTHAYMFALYLFPLCLFPSHVSSSSGSYCVPYTASHRYRFLISCAVLHRATPVCKGKGGSVSLWAVIWQLCMTNFQICTHPECSTCSTTSRSPRDFPRGEEEGEKADCLLPGMEISIHS